MNDCPLVSIIIPIYNAENILSRSIESIQKQTLKEIEIICVDDGSSDGTLKELYRIAESDDRIKVVHQENSGAGVARNTGLALAKGRYLSFLDADDIFKPNMLERACEEALKDDLDIVVYRSDLYYPATNRYESCVWTIQEKLLPKNYPFAGTDVDKDLFKVFVGWPWDKLFKASFIKEANIQYQALRTTNDMLFVFSAIAKAKRIGYLHDVLVHHVKEEGSLSVTREKSWDCFFKALCALREQLIEWNLFDRFRRDYTNYCVHAALWNVHTLAEPTKTMLKKKLRSEWASDLQIFDYNESYFYNKGEYQEFFEICSSNDVRRAQ